MKQNYLRDQRGVAMVFELVLVVAVLALAGVAVYQASHRSKTASTATGSIPPVNATTSLANAAAATSLQDSATDATLSASAETTTDELTATDADVSNLGSSSDGF